MTAPVLWTSGDAAAATGGRALATWQATGLSIDSRSLQPGDLFIALAGPSFDGHDYIAAALEAGAVAALAHRRPTEVADDAPLLMVDDTLTALTALGAAARARAACRLVAITGSVGKTGTKEALRRCLADQGPTSASAKSFNNHWGVPLSLARTTPDAAYGVFEIGMNHPGEIAALTKLVRPHVALITTVEPVHIEFFDSVAGVADAKAEIFDGVQPGGAAVLNRDNPFFPILVERAHDRGIREILSFGHHPEARVRATAVTRGPTGTRISARIAGLFDDRPLDYRIAMPGKHWVMNSLAVLAAAQALGADVVRAAESLGQVESLAGRGKQHLLAVAGGALRLIDDSYNANPTSVKAAIEVLGEADTGETEAGETGGRRIAVLGDMLELGTWAAEMHAGLAPALVRAGIDLVFCCGPHMAELYPALPEAMRGAHAADSTALAPVVAAAVRAGDCVLVKGSLGSRMAVVVAALNALGPEAGPDADGPSERRTKGE